LVVFVHLFSFKQHSIDVWVAQYFQKLIILAMVASDFYTTNLLTKQICKKSCNQVSSARIHCAENKSVAGKRF
jgi:hypothetical protein